MSNRNDTNERRRAAVERLVVARTALGKHTTSTDLQGFWTTRSDVLESEAENLERSHTITQIQEIHRRNGTNVNRWTLNQMSNGDLQAYLKDCQGRTERGEPLL